MAVEFAAVDALVARVLLDGEVEQAGLQLIRL